MELSYHSFPNFYKKKLLKTLAATIYHVQQMAAQIPKPTVLYMFYSDAIA